MRGLKAPNIRNITRRAAVNVPGLAGAVWWPLYDYQTYANAGVSSQQFFAVPKGQAGKTETDTNMELAGNIPAGQRFIVTGVGIDFYPGVEPDQVNVGASVNDFANDVYAVMQTGRLKLTIGSKDYINHGSLMKFPPVNRLGHSGAVATTAAATGLVSAYASVTGQEFATVDATIMANQNFSVTLYDLAALPSATDARIGVNLYGWLYRNAQ